MPDRHHAPEIFDYVIVGGGSAGCVLAGRLSERPDRRVLLLEAGLDDRSLFVRMPAAFVRVLGTERTWIYSTESEPGAKGRSLHVPQGRTLGGGSSVNAMVYIRGDRADYDGWHDAGCPGWGFEEVLPFFTRSEANERLAGRFHGTDGPLRVTDTPYRHPLNAAFVRAAQECGARYNDDFNGEGQLGTGFYQITAFAGERGSTARTYLAPALRRQNLAVRTRALATKILLRDKRASGIVYLDLSRQPVTVAANREVILAAGALATPKLLMLSGIGPADHLRDLGIEVAHALAGVGSNYQDHLETPVIARTREPISLYRSDRGFAALRHGLQWLLFRSGLLTSNLVESGGFWDLDGDGRADLQFHVLPVIVGDVDRAPLPGHGLSLNPCGLAPKSRGEIRLRSTRPSDPVQFRGNYLSSDDDVDVLVKGVRMARRFLGSPSLARLIETELMPGDGVDDDDEAALADYVRRFAKTVYHPAGTCRMGSDAGAVVDPQLRVHGLDGLRVADASVMPTLVRGNTNAPTIMIAERAADFIQRSLN